MEKGLKRLRRERKGVEEGVDKIGEEEEEEDVWGKT